MSDDLIKRSDAIKKIDEWIQYGSDRDDDIVISEFLSVLKGDIYSIPSADRPQEWIPCSERLPNIGEHHISEPCIVYCKSGVYAFAELEENIFGQVG